MVRPGGSGKAAGKAALQLQVSVPSFFRCPISLDVMKSPVSLCTGVTYDRASIQTWLDAGHNTCPATMQVLPTTDFVPNDNVRRLIQLWSTQPPQRQQQDDAAAASTAELVRRLQSSEENPIPPLRKLAEIAGDATRIRELVENADCVAAVNGVLTGEAPVLEEMELAVKILAPVLSGRKEKGYEIEKPPAMSSLLVVLKDGDFESRVAAAWVVDTITAAGNEAKKLLVAGTEGLLAELLRLLVDHDGGKPAEAACAVDSALSSLVAVASPRRVRPRIVALGAVSALGKLLARRSTSLPAVEKALKLMEMASTCPEGRAAICEDPAVVPAVVGRMMKVSPAATEHAAVVLWSVCHLFRDRRAQEAVAACNGLTKILLLMQSNCSPAAREMAGDLLRIFRVGSKSCLPGCEFKTTHIMPF